MPILNLILVDANYETDRIRVMTFSDPTGVQLPSYTAGAHIDFSLGECGNRSYSLIDWKPSKSPKSSYMVAVQCEEEGEGGSKAMHQLQPGDQVVVSEPSNDFEMVQSNAPVLLLAGGIGVTPLISMATELKGLGTQFQFHYTARSKDVMGFYDKLGAEFQANINFHFDNQTPIDLVSLFKQQEPGTQIYICGPKGMIDAARSAAKQAGHSEEAIHVELFSAPDTQLDDQPFEVEINDTGEVFTIPPGKTIIEVLEDAGKDLMFDCQRGDCGICQTDVISGTPDHRDVVLSQADRDSGKVMQICVSRAKSKRLILDL